MILFNSVLRQILIIFTLFFALIFHGAAFAEISLEIKINSASDDAEEYSSGEVNLHSSDLELVDALESTNQTIGIRFDSVSLPAGAIVNNAYLQFQVDERSTRATSLTFYGEANAAPVTYRRSSNNISNRPKTTENVSWSPANWNRVGAKGVNQQSPELKDIVQELVNQSGWNSGQSMAFMITGSGRRTAESYDGRRSGAPTLYIEYSIDSNSAPIASFTATLSTGNSPLDVNFDGSASSDDGSIASYNWDFGDGSGSATGVGTAHTYNTAGIYTATLTVTDDTGKTNSTNKSITVIDPNAPTTLNIQVSSSTDDAEEYASGSVSLNSSDLELVNAPESSNQTIGIRFNSVNLPTDAIISNAYLQFQADETSTRVTSLTFHGEANAAPVTYSRSSNNISNRLKTVASVSWSPTNWNAVGAKGIKQQSPDLKDIIQELVNQGGWNSGQSMAFMITGSGKRIAESYDGSQAGAPTLHIEYSTDGNPAPTASFTATPSTGNAPLEVSFDGSASSDDGTIASYSWDFGDGSSSAGVTTNHIYTAIGIYTATLTVTDDAGKTSSTDKTITAIDPNPLIAFDTQVSSSTDDAEEYASGEVSIYSSDLELADAPESTNQTIGIRFDSINLPVGAIISNAYLQFQTDETSTNATSLTLYGEANANAITYSSITNNISSRPKTTASVSWIPANWNTVGVKGVKQQSPELKDIVQELVNQSGWDSGQSMAFIITGSGTRIAESYDGSQAGAPTLHIEYRTDGNLAPIASFTINPSTGSDPLAFVFDGSASSDDNAVASYDWNFGDGTSATGITTNHTYTTAATYIVTLTVTDDAGKTNSISQTIIDPTANRVESSSDAAKFLSRASYGATQESINKLLTNVTYENWLQDQFNAPATLHLPKVKALATKMCANRDKNNAILLDSWEIGLPRHQVWWETALGSEDQLRQRVALALSEILVASDSEGLGLHEFQLSITSFYDIFVRNAFGNYRDILGEVTLHPVMGDFLSMTRNQKANEQEGIRPDENYAREVLQLFSIGVHELNIDGSEKLGSNNNPIPAYSQETIEEFAKVFTGWGYADIRWGGYFADSDHKIPLKAYEQYHDTSEKLLLNGASSPAGQTALVDLNFALDNIFSHPNIAPFISAQLIQRLVTSNPSPEYIERVANIFNNNGSGVKGDLKAVVKAILLDDEALAENKPTSFGKLREPMLRLSHLWRNFPIKAISKVGHYYEPDRTCGEGPYDYFKFDWSLDNLEKRTGQGPLQAKSVFNFFRPDYSPNGMLNDNGLKAPEFQIINENTYAGMSNLFYDLVMKFGNADNVSDQYNAIAGNRAKLDLNKVTSLASNINNLLDYLSLVLLDNKMSTELKTILSEHLSQAGVFPTGVDGQFIRAREAILLIVSSPEYLIQR